MFLRAAKILTILFIVSSKAFAVVPINGEYYCYTGPTDDMDFSSLYQCETATDGAKLCPVKKTKCYPPCPSGFSYNPSTGKCETSPSTQAQTETIYCGAPAGGTATCHPSQVENIQSATVLESYVWNGFSLVSATCVENLSIDPSHKYVYLTALPTTFCYAKIKINGSSLSCPSGSTYNSSTGKCETSPLNTGNYTCPIGNYACHPFSDGNYYCSPNPCSQYSTSNLKETSVTSTTYKNDAWNGTTCNGYIYIFAGEDKRCRTSGLLTGFQDCCETAKSLWEKTLQFLCTPSEISLAALREYTDKGKCKYIGEYCSTKWNFGSFSVCVQKKKTFCCFPSVLARVIQEQGREQLKKQGINISWGTPENPNCRGFTPEEFQLLDFTQMDFSEVKSSIQNSISNNISNYINNEIPNIQNIIKEMQK